MAPVSLRPHFIAPAMALCNLQFCNSAILHQHTTWDVPQYQCIPTSSLKPLLEVVSVSVSLSLLQPNSSSVDEINGFKLETIIRGEGK